jgi:6-phosphogluconolactonase (cycloisomerase 2 family)
MHRSRTTALLTGVSVAAGLLIATTASAAPRQLFTSSNDAGGNRVLIYDRAPHRGLAPGGSVPTGGLGTGGGLNNQGAIARAGHGLFVVDAGSDDVASFRLKNGSLDPRGRTPSGGQTPISVTVHGDLLYVLNSGQGGDIAGFRIRGGVLEPIDGSVQPLAGQGPAEIAFSPSGDRLYVTERTSNTIDTFRVDRAGRARPAVSTASSGATPFGFAVDPRGELVVSEAAGGPNGTSAVSSYRPDVGGLLTTITASAPDHQLAACWVALSEDARFAYTANAASDTISGYRIGGDGALSLLTPGGVTATTGDHPTDLVAGHRRGFFALAAGSGEIDAYLVHHDGTLSRVATATGVPASATGIAIG